MDKAAATSNVHEADAFSRKAAELVARHRIDPDALVEVGQDDLAVREITLGRGAYVRGRLALLMAVAEAHDSRVVFIATPTGTIAYVAGRVGDLDVVEVMYTSLHSQAAVADGDRPAVDICSHPAISTIVPLRLRRPGCQVVRRCPRGCRGGIGNAGGCRRKRPFAGAVGSRQRGGCVRCPEVRSGAHGEECGWCRGDRLERGK